MMQKMTTDECLHLLNLGIEEYIQIRDAFGTYYGIGIIVYENVAMDSAACGDRVATVYGPKCTIKELPKDTKCPIQLPNGKMAWKYKAIAYSDDLRS
jgi:uncharacterized protein CbrC (UPF0167 family)